MINLAYLLAINEVIFRLRKTFLRERTLLNVRSLLLLYCGCIHNFLTWPQSSFVRVIKSKLRLCLSDLVFLFAELVVSRYFL